MLSLELIYKNNPYLQELMKEHYSSPKGFVGRQIFYKINYNEHAYGCIGFGSATLFLPGREIIGTLNNGVNNIFYHCNKINSEYPIYNFTTAALNLAETAIIQDYKNKYGDEVNWLETLVELPRTGELYKRANWNLVGQTKGFTCKRIAGKSTDSWSGKRVWDTKNIKPKLVFVKDLKCYQ